KHHPGFDRDVVRLQDCGIGNRDKTFGAIEEKALVYFAGRVTRPLAGQGAMVGIKTIQGIVIRMPNTDQSAVVFASHAEYGEKRILAFDKAVATLNNHGITSLVIGRQTGDSQSIQIGSANSSVR